MKEWVLGFIILPAHVVLLKKSKTMHIGMWNGLGGKIEPGESAIDAMRREGREEAGGIEVNWKHAGYLRGDNNGEPWRVFLYGASGISKVDEIAEITADYAENAMFDTPYRIQYEEVSALSLAPHTKVLMYMAQDKIRYPHVEPVQLSVIS